MTSSDLLLFTTAHQFASPAVQTFYLGFGATVFWSQSLRHEIAVSLAVAVCWYVGLWLAQCVFNAIVLYSKKNHAVLTKHVVELQDDALYEETPYNRSLFYWNGIVKVVRRAGFVAVYLTPQLAHVIPRRAFESTAERDAFVALVKQKMHMAAGAR